MIQVKQKRCKGTGKAKGFDSCGEISIIKKYALCSNCYRKWLLTTLEGKKELEKYTLKAKKEVKVKKKRENKKAVIENKSIAVLIQEARSPFQKLIRIRDHGKTCICCDNPLPFNIGDYDAGHFAKAEIYSGLIFHPNNVNGQRTYCNKYLHGNEGEYSAKLSERIGQDAFNEIESLKPILKNYKWDRYKLIELKNYYKKELSLVEKGLKDIKEVDLTIGIIK